MHTKSIGWVVFAALGLIVVPAATQGQVINLAQNPSFEEDEVILNDPAWDKWATWGYDTGLNGTVKFDESERVDGARSLRIDPQGSVNWYFIVLNLPIPQKVGTKYTASFWAKAQAARPLGAQMKATDNTVSWGSTDFQITTDWAEYKFTTVAQNATVKLEIYCAASDVPLWLDFVNVYEGDYVPGLKPSRLSNPGRADRPTPADAATDVSSNALLGWTPGPWADTHNVYLGVSFTDVNSAGPADPHGVVVSLGQDANTFDPGRLEFGRTYFWRVDEVNAPPSSSVFKGSVWSFTVEPYSYPIAATHLKATASSSSSAGMGPQKTIDGSGLTKGDQHSVSPTDMWLSGKNGPLPVWIQYQFDGLYALDRVAVWNSNQLVESFLGFGARNVTIEYSVDGAAWTALGDFELARAPGLDAYLSNTTIAFAAVAVQYVKLTIHNNWGGMTPQCGLSEVRFYAVPLAAREPTPASGATNVAPQATLSWRPGRQAASHQVYLSRDKQAVIDGTAPTVVTSQPSYEPAVDLAQTYYWKVTEVNQAKDPTAWAGEVWSFSTAGFLAVDDFESYTDKEGSRIYESWIDGWDDPANGALVGHDEAPFAEQTIVHGGRQSLPLAYNNTAGVTNSEATRTFEAAQDWTKAGVTTLTLYFYGASGNAPNVPLWVKLTDQSNKSAKIAFGAAGEDVTALADPAWTPWNIALSGVSGVNLTRVKSITIGLGAGTGAGTLFIDDIRLYPAKAAAAAPAVLVGHWKLDNNAQDSSGNGNNGTLSGGPTWAAAGQIGGALSLDGVDDYVNCGNGAALNITDAITLSAWIKPADVGNSEHNPFVAKGDQGYALKHNTGNTLEFFVYEGGWYAANSAVLTASFNGTWHHVAGTYDGVQLKLYVDGVLAAGSLHTGVIASTTYDVNLGRDAQNVTRLYKGLIDDVRIYHGALPKSEILKLAHP